MSAHRSHSVSQSPSSSSEATTDEHLNHAIESIQKSQPSLVRVVNHLQEEVKLGKAVERVNSQLDPKLDDTKMRKERKAVDDEQHTPTMERPIQTLAAALSPSKDLSGKRKRSITHFEGIPISILSAPSPLTTSSSSLITRKFITKRNIKQLDQCFSRMNFGQHTVDENQKRNFKDDSEDESFSASSSAVSSPTSSSFAESETNSSRSSGNYISTPVGSERELIFDYSKGCGENKSNPNRNRNINSFNKCDTSNSDPESDFDSDDEDDVIFQLAP